MKMGNGWSKQNYRNHKKQSKMNEPVYTLSVCEDCDKSTEVVYKCYHDDNVVYKCHDCAFEEKG